MKSIAAMSTVSQSPDVLPGHYPPFATVSATDHSAWILIAASLGLVCTLVFGGLRTLVRGRSFGLDDYALLPAIALAIIQSSLVFGACASDFGKAFYLISPDNQVEVQRLFYTSNILTIIVVGLSKLSVPLILLRMSPVKHHRIIFYITIGSFVAVTLGSAITAALQCGSSKPWLTMGKECPQLVSNDLNQRTSAN